MNIVELALCQIEPETSRTELLKWFNEENTLKGVRQRFGDDTEALTYWPDDYYEKLKQWWSLPDNRMKDPINVIKDEFGQYRIQDGWHRFAISHQLQHQFIPVHLSGEKS